MAAILPLSALLIAALFAKETKRDVQSLFMDKSKSSAELSQKTPIKVFSRTSDSSSSSSSSSSGSSSTIASEGSSSAPLSLEILSLVINGFLLMYGK